MRLFRSPTPYPFPRLLPRCLSPFPSNSFCSSSSFTISQSRSHPKSSNSSARNNPSERRKPTPSEYSYGGSGSGVGGNRTSSSPIARLDISDENTYMPQKPATGKSGITIVKSWRHFNNNGERTSKAKYLAEVKKSVSKHGPQNLSVWARIVILSGVGTTLLESDLQRLVPGNPHIPEFKTEFNSFRVSAYRFPRSLRRRPFYNLIFSSSQAAKNFVYSQGDYWLSNTNSTIPPGQTPRLYFPGDQSKKFFDSNRLLAAILQRGACPPGACVLLVVSDIGGNTTETGKLPRTAEIRKMLEDADVKFCKRDELEGGVGLERRYFEKRNEDGTRVVDKFDGSGMGAEARWLVRCRDAAEAHRVVREWHRKEFREGGGKFSAEIIY